MPPSETFIRTQGEGLTRYRAHYLGLQKVDGLALPADRSYLLGDDGPFGSAKVVAFKLTGRSLALKAQLRSRRAEIIHAHFGTEAWRAMQLGRPLGLPVVVTFHGADATTSDDVLRRTSASARQLVRHRSEIFEKATLCIAVSEYIAERLVSQGCPRDKAVVHQIGVDAAWFRPKEAKPREGILFVGRLVEKKGLLQLLEAASAMRRPGCGAPILTIAGSGPQRAELEAAAERLRVSASFVGLQDHTAIRALMHDAKVLVVPSHTAASGESEGLPTVIREAQASGLPVVATRTAGSPEAITHGVDGLLVPPRDPAALARELARLLTDEDSQEALRVGGFRSAAAMDISKQNAALEDIYDDARMAWRQ